jgi:hypothetical protein
VLSGLNGRRVTNRLPVAKKTRPELLRLGLYSAAAEPNPTAPDAGPRLNFRFDFQTADHSNRHCERSEAIQARKKNWIASSQVLLKDVDGPRHNSASSPRIAREFFQSSAP